MGLLAGLCGLLNAARVGSVNGNTGTSFEMDAIGACFIGGASAYGGSGTIGGVVIGALLLGVINMGMSIMGIGDSWQYVVKGGVLLLAVISTWSPAASPARAEFEKFGPEVDLSVWPWYPVSRSQTQGRLRPEEDHSMLYIGIDLGTSAVKLLLMDQEGAVKNVVSKEYPWSSPPRLEPAGPRGLEKRRSHRHPRASEGL